MVALNGNILFANPAAANMFGSEIGELLGGDFGYPISNDLKTEFTIQNQLLGLITAEMEVSQTTWEGQPVYLVSLHDITARKMAEAEQQKSRKSLSNILESINDGFFTLNEDFVITYYNQAAARLLGQARITCVGPAAF